MPSHLQGRKHVLTDFQQAYHRMVDKYVWGLPPQKSDSEEPVETRSITKENSQ
jgi:hypothetical protein